MNIISVNVGLPKDLLIDDRRVPTGIFKTPVSGPVHVGTLNLAGDGQADLTVHGGLGKAVYAYPSEHYPFWEQTLGRKLSWGALGENLTIAGVTEADVSVGDHLGIGTAIFQVSQPRLPCFKLAGKFQRNDIINKMLDSRRTGFYLRVLQEGVLQAGDEIVRQQQDPAHLTIREITDIYLTKGPERTLVQRALSVEALAASWRNHFRSLGRP